jgi:hypothetical protein
MKLHIAIAACSGTQADSRLHRQHRGIVPTGRAVLCSGAALFLLVSSGHAVSQVTAVEGGSPDHLELALRVTASVAAQCGFADGAAPQGSYVAPDIEAGFTHEFAFSVQCKGPSRVAVESRNGGLRIPVVGIPAGYSGLANYRVTLHLVGNTGVPVANADCEASSLSVAALQPCEFRGPSSATRGLLLAGPSARISGSYLRIGAARRTGGDILVASAAYADTLTITLSAAM